MSLLCFEMTPETVSFSLDSSAPARPAAASAWADRFFEILRSMGQAGQEKSLTGEIDRPQLDVGLQQKIVDIAGQFVFFGKFGGVRLWPQTGGKHHIIGVR